MNIFKYQLLGEGQYFDLQNQIQFDDVIIEMSFGVFKNLGQGEEARKRSSSFTQIVKSSGEALTDFLQRLVSAVNNS